MLAAYEADHATGMDVEAVAHEAVVWTGGYPFLVSRVCQLMDEGGLSWDAGGVDEAVRLLLKDDDVSLFQPLTGKLQNYPELKEALRATLMRGEPLEYSPYDEAQQQLRMYGFTTERGGRVAVANRVFEALLYDHLLYEERSSPMRGEGDLGRSLYVRGGRLDMRAVLEGFRRAYTGVFGPPEDGERFCEDEGRKQFPLFLKPIINGTGNYYVEAETRDRTRTDVIVDYAGERHVVELKIWRGPAYNEGGEGQLVGYLDSLGLSVGYLLIFSFNRRDKEPDLRRVERGGKILWEEVV